MMEQAMFTYSPWGKALEKQTKTIKDQRRKEIDAIMNQNKRQAGLNNNNGKNLSHKKIIKSFFKDLMIAKIWKNKI